MSPMLFTPARNPTPSTTIAGLDVYIPLAGKFSVFVGGNMFMDKPYSEYDSQGALKGEFTPKDLFGAYRTESFDAALSLCNLGTGIDYGKV